eukprot:CAMPEP_0177631014 /NCGR_PEP_ID=MMETSP0447-20121125/1523_1 /TAXON_ID=0 /ORGANISM="Stygamoeba regulata, Strain BSH-02190019" /LENGTH=434 /DNA_ID=CAMNT_0019132469 /DNA_START=103 /DNA_END=1407 /DNA_ORIENTATION=-
MTKPKGKSKSNKSKSKRELLSSSAVRPLPRSAVAQHKRKRKRHTSSLAVSSSSSSSSPTSSPVPPRCQSSLPSVADSAAAAVASSASSSVTATTSAISGTTSSAADSPLSLQSPARSLSLSAARRSKSSASSTAKRSTSVTEYVSDLLLSVPGRTPPFAESTIESRLRQRGSLLLDNRSTAPASNQRATRHRLSHSSASSGSVSNLLSGLPSSATWTSASLASGRSSTDSPLSQNRALSAASSAALAAACNSSASGLQTAANLSSSGRSAVSTLHIGAVPCKQGQRKRLTAAERRSQHAHFDLASCVGRFEEYLPLHELWNEYACSIIGDGRLFPESATLQQTVARMDLHGSMIEVIRSKCPSLIGLRGIVLQEHTHVFRVLGRDDKLRVVPKRESVFEITAGGCRITLFGQHLCFRPSDRSNRKFRERSTIEL